MRTGTQPSRRAFLRSLISVPGAIAAVLTANHAPYRRPEILEVSLAPMGTEPGWESAGGFTIPDNVADELRAAIEQLTPGHRELVHRAKVSPPPAAWWDEADPLEA